MKFTEKYEILELLTSGRVSTFLARERATLEQVVVHAFECPATFGESRNSSILKYFASCAPSPAEPVTEVGFDEGTSSAFVVTKVPAPDALQSWVRAYRSFPGVEHKEVSHNENATAELSASELERLLRQSTKNERPPEAFAPISTEGFSPNPPLAPPQHKGEFTQLFQDPEAFRSLSDDAAPRRSETSVPAQSILTSQPEIPTNYTAVNPAFEAKPNLPEPDSPEPGSAESGSFTQQFFSGADDLPGGLGRRNAPPQPPGVKEPGAFTREFLAISGKTHPEAELAAGGVAGKQGPPAKSSPPALAFDSVAPSLSPSPKSPANKFDRSPEVLKSSTGEFTSFFSGPFDQPRAPEKPFEYPVDYPDSTQVGPSSPKAGDFTQMFGSDTPLPATESPSTKPPAQEPPKAPSFTQIFSESTKGASRLGVSSCLDTDPLTPATLKPPMGSTAGPSKTPVTFSSGTVSPIPSRGGGFSSPEVPNAPFGGESTFVNRSGRVDATNVFTPRGAEGAPVEPEAPSGPSDFTMFISRDQLRASLPPDPATAPAASAAPRAPGMPMPAMPPTPKSPYAVPAPPPMPPAAMPPLAAPQAPPAPRPPAPAAGRAASFWPLITVFTVLFFIAALLVMYFALKH